MVLDTLRKSLSRFKSHYLISLIAAGGIGVVVFSLGGAPLFENTNNFILFAEEEIMLAQGVQVSSGDIGSNNRIDINKKVLISGNLFADSITLDKNTIINGNATFNTLKALKDSQVLGTTTSPASLPIAELSPIPTFQPATEDFSFEGGSNTLPQGEYRNITLTRDSTLILTGGTYTLAKLSLQQNATLLFATTTTLNIEQEFKGQQNVSLLPGATANFDALTINYFGKRGNQKGRGTEPITFGNNSFLNFILIAPNATVNIGERSTVRGQILANKIRVGKESVLSREESFEKESDSEKVVEDQGVSFLANEIVALFENNTTDADVRDIISPISGTISGFVPNPPTYKITVPANTPTELFSIIEQLKALNAPSLIEVVPNIISQ